MFIFYKVKFQQFVSNKQFLPDSYTAFKNKIGLVNENRNYFTDSREIVLAWPYKDCVLEGGQTKDDQKRNEIFWNETLAPDEIDLLLSNKAFATSNGTKPLSPCPFPHKGKGRKPTLHMAKPQSPCPFPPKGKGGTRRKSPLHLERGLGVRLKILGWVKFSPQPPKSGNSLKSLRGLIGKRRQKQKTSFGRKFVISG